MTESLRVTDRRVGPAALEEIEQEIAEKRAAMTPKPEEAKPYIITDRRAGPKALAEANAEILAKKEAAHKEALERRATFHVVREKSEAPPAVAAVVERYGHLFDVRDIGTLEEYTRANEELIQAKRALETSPEPDGLDTPPALHHLDEHPETMSLDYIQGQYERAKFQGTLSRLYWESKLEEAQAPATPVAPHQEPVAPDTFRTQETPEPVADLALQEERARSEAAENMRTGGGGGWGSGFRTKVTSYYETAKQKVKAKWPFWKERLKGTATAGGLEYWHAEKFRRATKNVGSETKAQARLVEADEFVPFDALEKRLREQGLLFEGETFRDADKLDLQYVSQELLEDRFIANQEVEDRIVIDSKRQLVERLAKYITTDGIKGLNEDRWTEIEKLLRSKIKDIRENRGLDEVTNWVKLYREGFDTGVSKWNKWKMRYVYGAIESALWLAGGAIIWAKGGAAAAVGVAGFESARQLDPMDQNVWNTIDQVAQNEYGLNLSNPQLTELTKLAVEAPSNEVGVQVWNIPGSPMDTAMGQGHLIDLSVVREELSTMTPVK